MPDNEVRLVSKIIRERDLKPALDRGISADWFENPEAKAVWETSLDHWSTYGEVPTAVTVKDLLPGVTLLKVEDSMEYLIDQFVAFHRRAGLIDLVQQAGVLIEDSNHEDALRVLSAGLARLEDEGVASSRDTDLTRTVDERIDEYVALKSLPDGMRGLRTGFPTIDRATMGLQPGQLITLVATPKAGKSTFTLRVATNIHLAGKVPLFVSFEMSNDEQSARHDAMRSGTAHSRLLNGTITDADERALRRHLDRMKGQQPFHMTADPTGVSTVSGLAAKCETYNPDVLFVDGVYLMVDEISGEQNTPRALTNITRNIKRLAQRRQIPVFISTQALTWKVSKAKGITGDSIGYCVDETTEILTAQGWRTHDQVEEGDRVLTLNHKTGESEWLPLLAVNRFPAMSRELTLMEGKSHSSLTTGQHRWPVLHHYTRRGTVEREWTTTSELNAADYLITAAECGDLPATKTYSDDLVELVAWFWTEGHINGDYGNLGITQSHRVNPDNVARIQGCLERYFGPVTAPGPIPRNGRNSDGVPRWREHRREDRGLSEFWLSVDAGRLLLALAPNKVPSQQFLLSLTREQLHTYIRVSMLADRNGDMALSQNSRERAEAFQFACTLAGINTSLTEVPPSKSCPSTMWRVGMRVRQVVTPVAAARQGRRFTIQKVTHEGMIWCPTTANESWLARRNGQVYFTGNSSSFFQDSDVIFGLQHDEHETEDIRLLKVVASRNCPRIEVELNWDWTKGDFSEMGTSFT